MRILVLRRTTGSRSTYGTVLHRLLLCRRATGLEGAVQTLLAASSEADAETAAVSQAAQAVQEAEMEAQKARREQLQREVDDLRAAHE